MDLHISNYNNRFQIKGDLNKLNLKIFNDQFSNIFDKRDSILLDIEHVSSIDRAGVMALAKLHNESITKSKQLSIVGIGCKELYQHFKSEEPVRVVKEHVDFSNAIVAA
ncbi:STAS domain-containing protein [Winogradskyella sp. F6397]|uniref:STAS domain-containing protein n=1 Tax=Winogradskyella marina TaxID=2785530 RepID=A0ABS0EJC9_9FLAO|nr:MULTISPECIES: STAS domain-containing protein [Winogradskyella]MBF8148766.1 STAS domain-containing protein [Winogradskyella marina]